MAKMSAKEFQKYLDRDESCYATGQSGPRCVPQHRMNRQMGGSALLDVPSNIITFDSITNGQIESTAAWQRLARERGWKLVRGEDPLLVPIRHAVRGWVLIDNEFNITEAPASVVRARMEYLHGR